MDFGVILKGYQNALFEISAISEDYNANWSCFSNPFIEKQLHFSLALPCLKDADHRFVDKKASIYAAFRPFEKPSQQL